MKQIRFLLDKENRYGYKPEKTTRQLLAGLQSKMNYQILKSIFAAWLLLAAPTPALAQTEEALTAQCGALLEVSNAGSVKAWNKAQKQIDTHNSKVQACRNRIINNAQSKAQWDSIKSGEEIPGASVNGEKIHKCSHGGACLYEMMHLIRKGN